MAELMSNVCPVCGGPTRLQTATFEQSCSSCNRIAELENIIHRLLFDYDVDEEDEIRKVLEGE